MSNLDKKFKVEQILLIINNFIDSNQEIERRANELVELGFNLLDALHIASAELTGLDIFLTTDDDLLNTYNRHKNTINIKISNPIDWTKEMIL